MILHILVIVALISISTPLHSPSSTSQLKDQTVVMTGPFYNVTVLNSPPCDLPYDPSMCIENGTQPNPTSCALSCRLNNSCTAYTWHDETQGTWAFQCVFRVDNQWNMQSDAVGHVSGQKLKINSPAWPVNSYSPLAVMWFGANSTGLDNAETLSLISKHRVGGYGWQQGTGSLDPADNLGRGEVHLAEAATHLLDYLSDNNLNNTFVFVYRQIQVALRLFATDELATDNPDNDAFWMHDPNSGVLCQAAQPWGTSDPFWNFSNIDAVNFWLENTVAEVGSESSYGLGAVFFDECDQQYCGYASGPFGEGCAAQSTSLQRSLQASSNAMLAQMVAQLNSNSIIPILSFDNRMNASGIGLSIQPPCQLPLDDTISALDGLSYAIFCENFPSSFWVPDTIDLYAAMVSSSILEGNLGIPVIAHVPAGDCPDPGRNITRPGPLGGPLQYYLAAFLIVQTPKSVFSASTDWYDQNFCWHPEYDVVFGDPLAPAVRTSPYSWYRNFTACNVELDVSHGFGYVYLL